MVPDNDQPRKKAFKRTGTLFPYGKVPPGGFYFLVFLVPVL